jgi:hypothetical protein
MSRKEIAVGLSRASIVADQFRYGMCGTSAGVTNEALANGVPVVTNTDGAIYNQNDPYFGSPILDALEVDQIFQVFKNYEANPDYFKELGNKGKIWFDSNLGIGLAKKYLDLLTGT